MQKVESVENRNSLLSLNQVLEAVGGKAVLGNGDFYFSSVQTDSRLVEKDTLFVPLIGEFQDGHIYTEQACEKGASAVFIANKTYQKTRNYFVNISKKYQHVIFIAVENTLTALQKAAAKYVEQFPNLIKCAVTGSSGKTTTKEIAVSILKQKYNVISNKGNFNSETGLPLSVFNIRLEHEVGIFEMGMNRVDEINEIAQVLKPKYAIVTNIGTAHIGILGSRDNIAEEKSNVFNYFDSGSVGVIPVDDDYADFLTDKVTFRDGKVVYYGFSKYGVCADETVTDVKDLGLEGTAFKLQKYDAFLKIPGKYNFKNALGAVALARELGLTPDEIVRGINSLEPMFGRSEVIKGKYTVVQDCYNANPDSMEKSVEFISAVTLKDDAKKAFVLGDMLELGKDSYAEHKKVGELCASSDGDLYIFVGSEMKAAYDFFNEKNKDSSKKAFFVSGKDDEAINSAFEILKNNIPDSSVILIKGSRGIGLERLTKKLSGGKDE